MRVWVGTSKVHFKASMSTGWLNQGQTQLSGVRASAR